MATAFRPRPRPERSSHRHELPGGHLWLTEPRGGEDAAGALTAYYVRGDDLLAVMRPTGPATWSTRFVHADGIGSIRRLTDEAGAVTDSYTYTAFGERIAHTGTDPQPYAFAGEPYDPNPASSTTGPGGWIRVEGDSWGWIRGKD